MILTMEQYQDAAHKTAIQPQVVLFVRDDNFDEDGNWVYPLTGLVGEVGEVSQHVSKAIRDRKGHLSADEDLPKLEKELGDVLWYLSELATQLGLNLDRIATLNLQKLRDRQDRGVLGGSGDTR